MAITNAQKIEDYLHLQDEYIAEMIAQGKPFNSDGERVVNLSVVKARKRLREALLVLLGN